jgi:hypothetical protein
MTNTIHAQQVEIWYPLPPTLNEMVAVNRSSRYLGANQKEEWTNLCATESIGAPIFAGQVWMAFTWYVRNWSRDPDNIAAAAKFILDGLEQQGIIRNDNLTVVQQPWIHWFSKPGKGQEEGVYLKISSQPIYRISAIEQV